MKNKIKLFTVPLLISFICLGLGIISAVLALLNIEALLFMIFSLPYYGSGVIFREPL